MRKSIITLLLVSLAGCSYIARGEEDYRQATREVIEAEAQIKIKGCYDSALASDPGLKGDVVVDFTVEKKTGNFINPVATDASTAPQPLQDCVVNALSGLALKPEDRRDGSATFTWSFQGIG